MGELAILVRTHNHVCDGGKKLHIGDGETGDVLCGTKAVGMSWLSSDVVVDLDWVTQPDPGGELCKSCKKIATKQLSKK